MHLTWIFILKWKGIGTPHIEGPITHHLCLVPHQPWSTRLFYWFAINTDVESCAGSRIWVVLTTGTFLSSSYDLRTCSGSRDTSLLGCDTVLLGVLFWDVTLWVWVCCSGMWHCVVGCVVLGCDTVLLGVFLWDVTVLLGVLFWDVTLCCWVCFCEM